MNIAVCVAIAICAQSCASAGQHAHNIGSRKSNIYAATKLDYTVIRTATGMERTGGEEQDWAKSLAPIAMLDLPFSLTMDTLLLPFDLVRQGVISTRNTDDNKEFDEQGVPGCRRQSAFPSER